MNIKEARILRKIRHGDIKTFEALFHRYYPGMCSYAESLVHKPEISEEIVQDVFYNIWKNRAELNIIVSWKSYLFRSVFNNSMMYLRRAKRELYFEDQADRQDPEAHEQLSEEMDAREMNAVVLYTLESLPDRTSEIFKLSRFEGMKYREIADKLSISVKTVEANMGKALKALRNSLQQFRETA